MVIFLVTDLLYPPYISGGVLGPVLQLSELFHVPQGSQFSLFDLWEVDPSRLPEAYKNILSLQKEKFYVC